MTEKINIAELLKDCPSGMELNCTMYDDITLFGVDDMKFTIFPIRVLRKDGVSVELTKYGQYVDADYAKCVIFPKGKTTWEGFVPPYKFKNGDIYYIKDVFGQEWVSIIKKCENDKLYTYVDIGISNNTFYCEASEGTCYCKDIIEHRLATEEEKQKLFGAIKANGYYWNAENKTLEKLPKFKVGDKIKHKDNGIYCTLGEYSEGISAYRTDIGGLSITYKDMEQWELAPNKFDSTTLKPFDKVLVRRNEDKNWRCSFFSHMDEDLHTHCYKYVTVGGKSYPLCIPYEGNEHLCGTTDDCDEFYKNW